MSYFDSKKLREERKSIVDQMGEISTEISKSQRSMNSDELAKWDQLDSAQKELLAKIETAERFSMAPKAEEVVERSVAQHVANNQISGVTNYDCNQAVRGFLLRAAGESIPEECVRAAGKLRLNINSNTVLATRDQTIGTVGSGGYAVQEGAFIGFEEKMKAFGGLDTFCSILNSANGNPLPLLSMDDTSNVGAIRAELATTANTSLAFTKSTISSYRVSTAAYKISKELLRDSGVNMSEIVTRALATRLARKASQLWVSGAGTTEPLGLQSQASTSGVTLASNTAITYAELNNIYHSVDPAYRANARWVFNDACLAILKNAVDTTGRPLWVASLTQGAPDQLLGKPINVVQEVAGVGTSNVKCMYFGDFDNVTIRKVGGIEVNVFQEIYGLDNAVAVKADMYSDILVTQPAAVKFVTSKT